MVIPLFVERNLLLVVVASVVILALSARGNRILLWVMAALMAGAAIASGTVSIWWNGCRPLCGEGWDVPGLVVAAGVALAATLFSVQQLGHFKVPLWLRSAGAAVALWVILRANLSTWVS